MALTRGSKSLYPCPRDLTPANKLNIDGASFEKRSSEQSLGVISKASSWLEVTRSKHKVEEVLKQYSLRLVKVRV